MFHTNNTSSKYHPGDKVKITDGHFKGQSMFVQQATSAYVMLITDVTRQGGLQNIYTLPQSKVSLQSVSWWAD